MTTTSNPPAEGDEPESPVDLRCTIVSHTHWDREWYRSFESFRARLVNTVDRVLDLVESDPGYRFQLDGQSIAVEDYLELRPERREALEQACRAGRVAIGPWYVQPDSLLPSGEAHVRNLLEGRRVAEQFGPCCRQAYTPDSFGHPSQFPQLFAGFGLEPFIYWRGNGDEIEALGNEYRWRGPDGSAIPAYHLARGYFSAWGFGADCEANVRRLQQLASEIAATSKDGAILLMNGLDHMLPDENTREVAEALAKATGWEVRRGLLADFAEDLPDGPLPEFEGELIGGRCAPLLPGVWSTRMPLKLANRGCESALEGWAEPWSAMANRFGAADERPALRVAWRNLLANQAHDSICGCSKDQVHEQMQTRYETSLEMAEQTTQRALERIAGLGATRQVSRPEPASDGGAGNTALQIAVFNPSPRKRSELVRLPLEGFPSFTSSGMAPLLASNLGAAGFEVDGMPARLIAVAQTSRPRVTPGEPVYDLEFEARDVPALGWKRLTLSRAEARPDVVNDGTSIEADDVHVAANPDGSLSLRIGEQRFDGIAALEDMADRGDSYDFDPLDSEASFTPLRPSRISLRRTRHEIGIQELEICRELELPAALAEDRSSRSGEVATSRITTRVRIRRGSSRIDLHFRIENRSRDHRLRLLFPTGRGDEDFRAATTFAVARRSTVARDASDWVHPAPTTFPHQGWVKVGPLAIAAPGLPESEVNREGVVAITLSRSVGWLSRPDLTSRPGEAGPCLATPGAQLIGDFEARLCLSVAPVEEMANIARDFELGMKAVAAGPEPLVPADRDLIRLEPSSLVLSALKPSHDGVGIVLRVLNPSDREARARIQLGFDSDAVPVRLDETPASAEIRRDGRRIEIDVAPHALSTLLLSPPQSGPKRDEESGGA